MTIACHIYKLYQDTGFDIKKSHAEYEQSRFCHTMVQTKTGTDFLILFPAFGKAMTRQKSSQSRI